MLRLLLVFAFVSLGFAQTNCGPNEVLDSCGSKCEPTCGEPNPKPCATSCFMGCRCRQGFFRDDLGLCVSKCNQASSTPANCSEVKCPAGTRCEMVEVPCTRDPCPAPSPKCVTVPTTTTTTTTTTTKRQPSTTRPPPPPPTTRPPPAHRPPPPPPTTRPPPPPPTTRPPPAHRPPPPPPTTRPPPPPPTTRPPPAHRPPPPPPTTRPPPPPPTTRPPPAHRPPPPPPPPTTTKRPMLIPRCGVNEAFDTCGSACEPTCRNPNPVACTLQCVAGCRCRRGFFRDDRGQCVANCGPVPFIARPPPPTPVIVVSPPRVPSKPAPPPPKPTPKPKPSPPSKPSHPGQSSSHPKPPSNARPKRQGLQPSSWPGSSPELRSCSEVQCGWGTQCTMVVEPCFFISCAVPRPRCEPVQSNPQPLPVPTPPPQPSPMPGPRPPPQPSPMPGPRPPPQPSPMPGPPQPPRPSPPGPQQSAPTCANAACPAGYSCQMVSIQCQRPPCPPPEPYCFRVTPPQLRCPPNESWRQCSTRCEPTCSNMNPTCNKACGEPKCQCDPGYFRNRFGSCVSRTECRA